MAVHIVEDGECLSSLAARYGLPGWKALHDHPANAALKKKRPNPNVLAPGDQVMVPDRETKSVSGVTGRRHTFVVTRRTVKLRVALVNRSGKPYAGKRFIVNVGPLEITGTTASDGMVEVEVRATESTARLRAWLGDDDENAYPTIDRELAIGHIDPIDRLSGVRERLLNLGYHCPVSDDPIEDLGDQTLVAVRSFRARNGLPAVVRPGLKDIQDDDQDATSHGNAETASDADAQPEANDEPTAEEIKEYVAQLIDEAFRQKLLAAYGARA